MSLPVGNGWGTMGCWRLFHDFLWICHVVGSMFQWQDGIELVNLIYRILQALLTLLISISGWYFCSPWLLGPKSVHSIPLPRRHSSRRWGPTKLGDAGNATFPNGELGMVQMALGSHIRQDSCGMLWWNGEEESIATSINQCSIGLATDLAGAQCSTAAVHIQKRPVERIGPGWRVKCDGIISMSVCESLK